MVREASLLAVWHITLPTVHSTETSTGPLLNNSGLSALVENVSIECVATLTWPQPLVTCWLRTVSQHTSKKRLLEVRYLNAFHGG